MLRWLLAVPVGLVCLFQCYYLVQSLRVRLARHPLALVAPGEAEQVSVLIPVFNSASTLGRCLDSILAGDLKYVAEVVVVLDRCTDGSEQVAQSFAERFAEAGSALHVVALPDGQVGKVAGMLHGGAFVSAGTVLLLDADIVLEPSAIEEMVSFHAQAPTPFTSCLVYPFQDAGARPTLVDHVICNNRLYRQGVLQAVKNLHGVANFPGGVQMVDFAEYRRLLVDGFLEDLSATYQVLAAGGTVAVLDRVLAYEIERSSLKGLFLQRVRWTIGAIQHLPTQVRTARRRRGWNEKVLVNSYHVMWEFQHYAVALSALAVPLAGPLAFVPLGLYAAQIARSAGIGRAHYRNSWPGAALHCLVFPTVITAALVGSLALLARRRTFFFRTSALFSRQ